MSRPAPKSPLLAERFLRCVALGAVAGAVLLIGARGADAALTTGGCLAQKRTAWGDFRKCQAAAAAKGLKGKPADLAACLTKFQVKLAKISAKGAKAAIECRDGDNGDGTVTDYDTGLQWEKKDGAGGAPDVANPHDVDNTYGWGLNLDVGFSAIRDGLAFTDFLSRLNDSESSDGVTELPCFTGHCDWRLPTIAQLQSILSLGAPGCAGGSPCINPVFGLTTAGRYWTNTSNLDSPGNAWFVNFFDGAVDYMGKDCGVYVRAVRTGL